MQDARKPCPYPPKHPKQLLWLRRRAALGVPLFHPFDADLDENHGFIPKEVHVDNVMTEGLAQWTGSIWKILDRWIRRYKRGKHHRRNGESIEEFRVRMKERMRELRAQRKGQVIERPPCLTREQSQELRKGIFQ